jgi:hypothetical protein
MRAPSMVAAAPTGGSGAPFPPSASLASSLERARAVASASLDRRMEDCEGRPTSVPGARPATLDGSLRQVPHLKTTTPFPRRASKTTYRQTSWPVE